MVLITRKAIAETKAKQQIGKCTGGATVAIGEWMDPVQFPQSVGSQVEWCALLPIVVNIITHVFDFFWDQMRTDRLMFAALDFDSSWPPISREGTQAIEGDAMQI
jgi:hypothetical protein